VAGEEWLVLASHASNRERTRYCTGRAEACKVDIHRSHLSPPDWKEIRWHSYLFQFRHCKLD